MIKDENYIVLPGWVSTKLKLKGNEQLVFSIIYGFCQDGHSCYHGSLEYLQEWTNSTRQGIIGTIKKLIEKGLIEKKESFPNNEYRVAKDVCCKFSSSKSKQLLQEDSKTNLQNNINNNNIDFNKDKYKESKENRELIESIITELNKVCGSNFKTNSLSTQRIIRAKLKEGFSKDDFSKVITYKYNEWGKNPTKFSNGKTSDTYLRPSTLFGSKFETYLFEANKSTTTKTQEVKSIKKLDDRSSKEF